jgi:AcrR family transcriptional regulator
MRRQRTEQSILEAARELFAELGFEKATIRAVASRAGIDPALVMQYYGNKEGLFAASAMWKTEHKKLYDAALEDIPSAALDDVFATFADPADRDASIALLRNCLTHATAREIMRDEVMCDAQAKVADAIGGDDAELRAGLLAASMMGLMMTRYLLELPAVANATQEQIEAIMLPVLRQLVDPS